MSIERLEELHVGRHDEWHVPVFRHELGVLQSFVRSLLGIYI